MKRVFRSLLLLATIAAISQPSRAEETSPKLQWKSIKLLTSDLEKQKVQAALDDNSCSGVPTKRKKIPESADMGAMIDLETTICNEAEFARIQSPNGNQLLMLQYGSMGSCGDFDDVFFSENTTSDEITRVDGPRFKFICGGGLYAVKHTDEGDVLIVVGGIDEVRHGNEYRGDLKLLWDGMVLKDISDKPRKYR